MLAEAKERLVNQAQLQQQIEALEKERLEADQTKIDLVHQIKLERVINQKAIQEVKGLKLQQIKDKNSISNEARKSLEKDEQVVRLNTTLVHKENEVANLRIEVSNLKIANATLEGDSIRAQQERDKAFLEVSNAQDKEKQMTERILRNNSKTCLVKKTGKRLDFMLIPGVSLMNPWDSY
ncbi:unnamed protein product [Calypogeia fissa]